MIALDYIPQYVDILGHHYTIVEAHVDWNSAASYEEIELGNHDPFTLTITVPANAPLAVKLHVLGHEVIHAWENLLGLDLGEMKAGQKGRVNLNDLLGLALIQTKFGPMPVFKEVRPFIG